MPTRSSEHLQNTTLKRLREKVPHDCPLLVRRAPGGGFAVETLAVDHVVGTTGRFQVVAAWIDGYVAGWWSAR